MRAFLLQFYPKRKAMQNTDNKKFDYFQPHWLVLYILVILLGFMVHGCIPPPPRAAPRPPTPPGGPHPEAVIRVRPGNIVNALSSNNFNNFSV